MADGWAGAEMLVFSACAHRLTDRWMDKASYREANPQLTRPDTGLARSRAGGQGLYLRSGQYLGRSGMPKKPINAEKVVTDRRMNGRSDRPTKRGVESRSTRLQIIYCYNKSFLNFTIKENKRYCIVQIIHVK